MDRLIQELVGATRAHVTGLFDEGCIALNGKPIREPWWRLRAGDKVRVRYEAQRRYSPKPAPRMHHGFAVLYEDQDCIVVDKAAELLTIPTRRKEGGTLVDLVRDYLKRSRRGSEVHAVHRLDRGVSGVLVLAKSSEVAASLRDQFAGRKPERRYVAVVAGIVGPAQGEFRSLLATDEDLNRYSTDDQEVGQLAITHYRVLERFEGREGFEGSTLIDVGLETGRRNQIRVHFAEAGHPVLGDPRYGGARTRHRQWRFDRIALHAKTLAFRHPESGEMIQMEARYPAEMVRFLTDISDPHAGPISAVERKPPRRYNSD